MTKQNAIKALEQAAEWLRNDVHGLMRGRRKTHLIPTKRQYKKPRMRLQGGHHRNENRLTLFTMPGWMHGRRTMKRKLCTKAKRHNCVAFGKHPNAPDGLQYHCRDCKSAARRAYHATKGREYRGSTRPTPVTRTDLRLMEYLSNHPCTDCGRRILSCSTSITLAIRRMESLR